MITKINLADKFTKLDELWSPRVIGSVDGTHLAKISKLQGEFVWHAHDHEDELFLIVAGHLMIELEDQTLELAAGELCVIPAGTRHRPIAPGECHVLVFEKQSTAHTGGESSDLTRGLEDQLRPI